MNVLCSISSKSCLQRSAVGLFWELGISRGGPGGEQRSTHDAAEEFTASSCTSNLQRTPHGFDSRHSKTALSWPGLSHLVCQQQVGEHQANGHDDCLTGCPIIKC